MRWPKKSGQLPAEYLALEKEGLDLKEKICLIDMSSEKKGIAKRRIEEIGIQLQTMRDAGF